MYKKSIQIVVACSLYNRKLELATTTKNEFAERLGSISSFHLECLTEDRRCRQSQILLVP